MPFDCPLPIDERDMRWLHHLDGQAQAFLGGVIDNFLKTDQLQDYRAYPKQQEFHAAGRIYRNRLLRAGNQAGKSLACGAEMAMHLTGEYPKWWRGHRFSHPILAWAAGETADATRDNPQRVLFGLPGQMGTGMVPKRCLTGHFGSSKAITNLYDFVMVRHVTGGISMVRFRFYAQERETWQGPPVNCMWYDEEPPMDMYSEGIARTAAVRGISLMSFTPLKGFSEVVSSYIDDEGLGPGQTDRHTTVMTLRDSGHFDDEEIERRKRSYPKHEWGARIDGEPMLGEGRIFRTDEDVILEEPFDIPAHWPVLGGIDIGFNPHPTAAVKIAWDRDNDVIHVVRDYRRKELTPSEHWLTLKHFGAHLKWAWPRDGSEQEKGSGRAVIDLYKDEGLHALPEFAKFAESRRKTMGKHQNLIQSVVSVERGIMEMEERFEQGRLRVFSTCSLLLEEYRMYHRKDGKIVKERDDVLDALRYALMSLRFADVAEPKPRKPRRRGPDWQAGGM